MRIVILKMMLLLLSAYNNLNAQLPKDSLTHFSKLLSYELMDVKQQKNTAIFLNDKPLNLFIFLSPECPLCKNYIPQINELKKMFGTQVNIYGIVPGIAYSVKEVKIFTNTYHAAFDLFIDPQQKFTHYLQATVTPQAILLDNKMKLIYTGAIDDWVQAQGKKKLQVTQHYLHTAIEQSLQLKDVLIKKTKVFGCKINDY